MNKKYAGLDFPAWFDGKDINEAAFCREFLSKNKLIYADNAFFTPDGRLTDPLLLKEKIYAELECCAAKNIPRTISNIVEIMKLAAHAENFPPKPDEIHVQNGTLRIDGSFLAGRPEIVRSRFPVHSLLELLRGQFPGLDVKGYGLFVGFLLQWVSSFRFLWWYARRREAGRA